MVSVRGADGSNGSDMVPAGIVSTLCSSRATS